jgi:hypothetical protein
VISSNEGSTTWNVKTVRATAMHDLQACHIQLELTEIRLAQMEVCAREALDERSGDLTTHFEIDTLQLTASRNSTIETPARRFRYARYLHFTCVQHFFVLCDHKPIHCFSRCDLEHRSQAS